ncbi:MAG: zinc ribbon domain-containing protein [Clostridia bacterium]|nr:zinc ribbon domain-containing protein [Clostridia bacterium]
MFCPHCGQQIADGSAFCSVCGKSTTNVAPAPVIDYQAQKQAVRQSEISSLSRALDHFNQKRDEFTEYDCVCELVNHYAQGAKGALLVWGIIIATAGLLMLMVPEAFIGALTAFVVPGGAMIFGGIMMKVKNRKNYAYFQQEYARLSEELYNHYVSYPNCPVGPEYANPEILEIILGVLQSGRADTIKEAINLLIDDAERSEMSEYLEMIEQNTAAINAQTRVAAVFAAANFFKD